MNSIIKKGFTLVELVIVIGVIGIIATILLIALNPAETQRKARDTARLKDINTLQGIVEQAVNDVLPLCAGAIGGTNAVCQSDLIATPGSQPCAANWTGINLCNYTRTVPADPLNIAAGRCTQSSGAQRTDCNMYYYMEVAGTDYEINVRMESTGNAAKIANDGGNHIWVFEIFSGSNNVIGTGTSATLPNQNL